MYKHPPTVCAVGHTTYILHICKSIDRCKMFPGSHKPTYSRMLLCVTDSPGMGEGTRPGVCARTLEVQPHLARFDLLSLGPACGPEPEMWHDSLFLCDP